MEKRREAILGMPRLIREWKKVRGLETLFSAVHLADMLLCRQGEAGGTNFHDRRLGLDLFAIRRPFNRMYELMYKSVQKTFSSTKISKTIEAIQGIEPAYRSYLGLLKANSLKLPRGHVEGPVYSIPCFVHGIHCVARRGHSDILTCKISSIGAHVTPLSQTDSATQKPVFTGGSNG
jgi:hypothetical protein